MTCKDLAEVVRAACVSAAAEAHEDAGMQGLCDEGRGEAVVSALQRLDLEVLLARLGVAGDGPVVVESLRPPGA